MYSDDDLNLAITKGVFSESSVAEFRQLLASTRQSPAVDEENFRLIGGFNDIFVVIACSLLLFSSLWVFNSTTGHDSIGLAVFSIIAWGLSEFFIRQRKMALPAIMLLLSFIGGMFFFALSFFSQPAELPMAISAALATAAAYAHWLRFRVPITIAAGTAAATGLVVSLLLSALPNGQDWLLEIVLFCGLLTFALAMYWDASDTARITRRSDAAFWLHLLSAPLIIHPVFAYLGVLDGNDSIATMVAVLLLYIVMSSISIAIDRRAFMVSSLAYVLYALSNLINNYGGAGYSFALTGVVMGAALLFLSAYWHPVRKHLVAILPTALQAKIPASEQ